MAIEGVSYWRTFILLWFGAALLFWVPALVGMLLADSLKMFGWYVFVFLLLQIYVVPALALYWVLAASFDWRRNRRGLVYSVPVVSLLTVSAWALINRIWHGGGMDWHLAATLAAGATVLAVLAWLCLPKPPVKAND